MIRGLMKKSVRGRKSKGEIETVRNASNAKLDALGEETVN